MCNIFWKPSTSHFIIFKQLKICNEFLILLTNRRSTQVQTQIFIERKLQHNAHNTKHNIKNTPRFLSHENTQTCVMKRREPNHQHQSI